MAKACLIFLAEGFEEIEALTVVDLLRRESLDIKMVSITENKQVSGSHGITVNVDMTLGEVVPEEAEMLILPGGMPGTTNLKNCKKLTDMILTFDENKEKIAAICAAPTVFGYLGILKGKKATCYPGCEDQLTGADVVYDSVVTDGNITTSRGMGTAIDFGLEIVSILKNKEAADALAAKIVY